MDLTNPNDVIPLRTGARMPRLGLGVFRMGAGTYDAVRYALDAGYRHIDTAAIYQNEEAVGRAIADSGIDREELFVTTKLWNDDQGRSRVRGAFEKSLSRLGLDYVDLYLLHWPVPKLRIESWKMLERLRFEGKARAIGVSNFTVAHLNELAKHALDLPAVNQVELHPYLHQWDLVARCRQLGVVVEAYSPLAKATRLDNPTVVAVAEALGRTPAQVLIRWGLQRGFVVIPKSVTPARIVENRAVFDFELDPAHLALLDALDEGLRTAWDPTDVP